MPSLIGQTVAANYLKTKPSTRFGTRDLAFLVIDYDNSNYFNNWDMPNSNFTKVVRLVQTHAEIYAVGEPAGGIVTIVVAIDTANDGSNTEINAPYGNDKARTIGQALAEAGIEPDTVHFRRLVGKNLDNGQDMNGYGAGGETYVD